MPSAPMQRSIGFIQAIAVVGLTVSVAILLAAGCALAGVFVSLPELSGSHMPRVSFAPDARPARRRESAP